MKVGFKLPEKVGRGNRVAVGYAFSFLFGIAVALYGRYVGSGWSGLQMIAIGGACMGVLCGGVIAYNHPAIKKRQLMEENNLALLPS